MENFLQVATEYGFLGVGLVCMAGYIWKKEKWHRDERSEWREQAKDQNEKLLESNSSVVIVISELKAALKNIEKAVNRQ